MKKRKEKTEENYKNFRGGEFRPLPLPSDGASPEKKLISKEVGGGGGLLSLQAGSSLVFSLYLSFSLEATTSPFSPHKNVVLIYKGAASAPQKYNPDLPPAAAPVMPAPPPPYSQVDPFIHGIFPNL